MKKRIIGAVLLFACMMLGGCSWRSVDTGNKDLFSGKKKASQFRMIGTYGENKKSVYVLNSTGDTITKVWLRKSGDSRWGQDLLKNSKQIAKNEKVALLLGKLETSEKIDMKLAFKKNKTKVVTNILPKDTKSLRVYKTDHIAYIEYVSNKQKDIVSTKSVEEKRWQEAERKRKEEEKRKAAEEARKLELARQQAEAQRQAQQAAAAAKKSASSPSKKKTSGRQEENCADSAQSGHYIDDGNGGWKWVPNK